MNKGFFKNEYLDSLKTIGGRLLYILFLIPWDMFVTAAQRLAEMRKQEALNLNKITTPWPYISFLKRLFIDFIYDALIVLCYTLAPIAAIFILFIIPISAAVAGGAEGFGLGLLGGIGAMIGTLVGCYYSSVFWTLCKDLTVVCILPLRKLLTWFKRPAQYLEIDNKVINK